MTNSTTSNPVDLGPDEIVEGRPFAHPDHVSADRSTLGMLARDIARRLAAASGPIEAWIPSPESWHRHVIIPRPHDIGRRTELTVIGFFGRRRDIVPLEIARRIQDMSAALDRCIPEVDGVLAYSTHLLADELNYANLVLLDSPETIAAWRATAPHPAAAGELSKEYYAFVRIYQGWVEVARLGQESAIRLDRVKYWDYRPDPTWTGVRELGPE